MKRLIYLSIATGLIFGGCAERGVPVTGTLDCNGESTIVSAVVAGTNQTIGKGVDVVDGKFTVKLSDVPEEFTNEWKKDNVTHVRVAEASFIAYSGDENERKIRCLSKGGEILYWYADRNAYIGDFTGSVSSQYLNWAIGYWMRTENIPVTYKGQLKKGWNRVLCEYSNTVPLFGGERKKKVTMEVMISADTALHRFISDREGALQPPPTGTFNGNIKGTTVWDNITVDFGSDRLTTAEFNAMLQPGYSSRVMVELQKWTIPLTNEKFNCTLPVPGKKKLDHNNFKNVFFNRLGAASYDGLEYSAGSESVEVAVPHFSDSNDITIYAYQGNNRVLYIYADDSAIITGFMKTGQEEYHMNLNLQKGWNTVICKLKYEKIYECETATIEGEVELKSN